VSLISTGKKQIRSLQRQTERQLLVASAKSKTRNSFHKPILLGATNSAGQANSWAMALHKTGSLKSLALISLTTFASFFATNFTLIRVDARQTKFSA
jgi:hypothetical protein